MQAAPSNALLENPLVISFLLCSAFYSSWYEILKNISLPHLISLFLLLTGSRIGWRSPFN
jgi:hypothetical protein